MRFYFLDIMIKLKKPKISNLIFIVILLMFLIPQIRQPFQVLLHKGLSYVSQSSIIDEDDRVVVSGINWQLISDKGTTLNFVDTKGKVVFINFWATWCPPCIAEMPSIQALYNDYKDKVEFLLITNEDFEVINNFKIKEDFNFEIYNPLNEIPEALTTRSIPRTFILNKNREIVVDESGAINWNSDMVKKQLDNLLTE